MRFVIRTAALAVASWVICLSAWSVRGDELITINLMDADLVTAVKAITQQLDVQVVFEHTDKPYGKITFLKIKDKTFEEALSHICQAAGATYRKEGNNVFVIGPIRPVEEQQPLPIASNTTTAINVPVEPVKPNLRLEKIQLKYTRPTDIVRIIKWEMRTDDPFADLREFERRALPTPYVPPNVPLNMNGQPMWGNGASAQPDQAGEGQFTGGRGGGRGGAGGFGGQPGGGFGGQPGGGFGQPGGGFGQPGGGFGQPGGAGGAGNPLLPSEGQLDILGFDPDNTLIVRGTDENVEYIKRIVRFLDVAPKQVLIRAEYITVGTNELRQFGIDWSLSRVNLTTGATGFAARDNQVFVNYATGNLVTSLRTQLSEGKAKIVTAPIITTMNNTPATIFSTEQSWIVTQTVVFDQNGRPTTFSQPIPIQAVTQLTVTPRINADMTITLALSPQVQEFRDTVRTSAGDLPVIVSQTVLTVRRIKNGETMVIGGLVRKSERNRTVKVPILADLPIIGSLFRSLDRSSDDSELLIFITAEVLPDPLESTQGGIVP
jgi:general secretion pathway protein D